MWNGNNGYGGYGYPQNNNYGYGGYSYQQAPQPQVQQSVNTNKLYTTGIDDVRTRQLPVNSDFIFLDNDKPLIYRKTTDATGKMDIQVFKIIPYQEEEKPDSKVDLSNYVSMDDFHRLEQQFEELKKSLSKPETTKPVTKKTI